MRIPLLFLLLSSASARAQTLDDAERKELQSYLAELKKGAAGSAAQVERLAALPYDGLLETMRVYATLKKPIEPHSHRAFQSLLERLSREALSPWPMVQLYAPELAAFMTKPPLKNAVADLLFQQLLASDAGRLAFDLCVRLAPSASLEHLATPQLPQKPGLFDAWNRRLSSGRESRPLPELEKLLERIADAFSFEGPPIEEREPHLRFLASWPELRKQYLARLKSALDHPRNFEVDVGLKVQRHVPALLELNEGIVQRCKDAAFIVEGALRNYAFDESANHSATLRKLWAKLPAEKVKARYACLFAMGVHPKGNDAIALEAVEKDAFELFDVAIPVLRRGDPAKARAAVAHVLKGKRGHEEALRLARDLRAGGFEEDALKIALDDDRDQILRQTAMLYLDNAEGKHRFKLLPCLAYPKNDLRLTAIRAFVDPKGLGKEDRREIGPTLVKVALADPSMGHRQEAIHVLGCWKAPETMEFFRKLQSDNPPVVLTDGYYSDARYWQYRFRLMATLGLAKLGDPKARSELLALHGKGSPAEKMDVLLAFLDLGEVPKEAWGDLDSPEPRLVATAAQLIARHGDAAAKEKLKKRFAESRMWRLFRGSGIDDYGILRIAEGK